MTRRLLTSIALAPLLFGCASTDSPAENKENISNNFDNANLVVSTLDESKNANYLTNFETIASGFGVSAAELKSEYGPFYLFRLKTGNTSPLHKHPFFDSAKKSFNDYCPGKLTPLIRFEEADRKGLLDPLLYTSEENLNLMKKHAVSFSRNEPNYLPLSYSAMIDREKEEYRYSLSHISRLFLNNPAELGDSYVWPKRTINFISDAQQVCYFEGKPHGAVIYFSSYTGVTKGNHTSAKPGTHALVGMYLPPETTNNVSQYAFDSRLANVKRQSAEVEKRENERLAKQKIIDTHNQYRTSVWAERFDETYMAGDKVCTPDNRMGYVESANDRNVKVWFKGVVTNKDSNFFFGNSSSLPDSRFYIRKLDEVTWVNKGNIARCDFTSV